MKFSLSCQPIEITEELNSKIIDAKADAKKMAKNLLIKTSS